MIARLLPLALAMGGFIKELGEGARGHSLCSNLGGDKKIVSVLADVVDLLVGDHGDLVEAAAHVLLARGLELGSGHGLDQLKQVQDARRDLLLRVPAVVRHRRVLYAGGWDGRACVSVLMCARGISQQGAHWYLFAGRKQTRCSSWAHNWRGMGAKTSARRSGETVAACGKMLQAGE